MRRPRLSSLAAAVVTAVLPLAALGGPASAAPDGPGRPDRVTLLQMNQCLSGYAGCFGRTAYPAVVDETIERIEENDADVVVLNESCSGDAERVARETGMHLTFSTVIYGGTELDCRRPEGRGVFGNAVLTRAEPLAVIDRAYDGQHGREERRVACVVTDGLTACGTHLSVRGSAEAEAEAANDAQCEELRELILDLGRLQPVVAAGDVNRQGSCAPSRAWTLTDAAATQAPGIQHVYGERRLTRPSLELEPATYTDHDVVVARFDVHPGSRTRH
ncbi:endonuclease/exonuclease/phosphatase family protein [Nocardioides sp. SYSU DS0663]|uniref:endonuclease/exonuclease/phosphatase family protein n=1 Tax=Nocardioides sp. SYSU DS0663 TaxID=3416445 RepID=UPI003F4B449A